MRKFSHVSKKSFIFIDNSLTQHITVISVQEVFVSTVDVQLFTIKDHHRDRLLKITIETDYKDHHRDRLSKITIETDYKRSP